MSLQPLFGILVLIGLAFALSEARKSIRWRTLAVGLALQMLLAFLVLKTVAGKWFFQGSQSFFNGLINIAKQAGRGVLGDHVLGFGEEPAVLGAVVLVTVVFFSSVFAVMHHLGLVRLIVGFMAKIMSKLMGTSGTESTVAAANIFVGQTEAPLLIRPYLPKMTRSELGAIMTVGFATVAGGVFAVYVEMMQDTVPDIAGHLLAATVMSAPMGLAIAKVVFPETETSETLGRDVAQPPSDYSNGLDAAASGAADGMKLSLNILAMLIAFLGLLGLVNVVINLAWEGHDLQGILGTLFAPFAWLIGVPASEASDVGGLLGTKMAVNEYVAFLELGHLKEAGLSDRSRIIASYALCGFSNFSSIAIQIGGLSTIAPGRRSEFARLGFRAMCA
ncbi:MAG: nucleoside transporter C-terminal domain-containing protein, partial [Planctomycetota bacterium]